MADDNQQGGFQRQMYEGEWKCSKCGGEITKLPFQPDPSRIDQLKCRDCYMSNRPPRRDQ